MIKQIINITAGIVIEIGAIVFIMLICFVISRLFTI